MPEIKGMEGNAGGCQNIAKIRGRGGGGGWGEIKKELAEIGSDEGRGWEAANCHDLPSNGRN